MYTYFRAQHVDSNTYHIYIYIYIHTYKHIYIHTYLYTHVCMYTYIRTQCVDSQSTNGILHNGVKVLQAQLQNGDTLTFGGAAKTPVNQRPGPKVRERAS